MCNPFKVYHAETIFIPGLLAAGHAGAHGTPWTIFNAIQRSLQLGFCTRLHARRKPYIAFRSTRFYADGLDQQNNLGENEWQALHDGAGPGGSRRSVTGIAATNLQGSALCFR